MRGGRFPARVADRRGPRHPPSMNPSRLLYIYVLVHVGLAFAQAEPAPSPQEQARANFARPIELAPDDVRAFAEAPAGFKAVRDVPHGRIESFEYGSEVTGTHRKANVYL